MSAPDMFDRLPHLWSTSSQNPAVIARQRASEERTRMLADNDPTYAADLVRLQDAISSYEIPTKEDA